ncbi:MAG: acyl-CoA dehydrogenase family protein [Kofleriaceae bacterium]|nr:acyl-CoA dehydrogenase family protein [Myxococcales bacterium]MCB9561275.1 acyl-CoA dehydrogenase family protein [Kofleriaceae bacterium]
MDLRFSADDEAFRAEVRGWLDTQLAGEFRHLRGQGGPGHEHEHLDGRRAWERVLGAAGWIGLGWPRAAGGQGASLLRQVIFHEEYARARGPGRLGHIGEHLLGPTVAAFGTDAQRARVLPPIARGEALWCQGYSEPGAGSDLAGVQTRAELVGRQWRITGQKIWTSHAHIADACFVLCRTDPASSRHQGLSYLLVPMRQAGVTVRPIQQLTGTSEFCEVFFDDARTDADQVVGEIGGGWRVAMATLTFERGASTLGQQIGFAAELDAIIAAARARGADRDAVIRQRLADAWIGLQVMRWNALRMLAHGERGELPREALMTKLSWATWHRTLGELAMDVLGPDAEVTDGAPYQLTTLQQTFLFSRADTIYAGSNEIQKNIIATRALGLPRGA